MLEIVDQPIGEIEVKRFYIEGLKMYYTCPSKNHMWNDYLSYPDMNIPMDLHLYCNECDHEWTEKIILKVSIEVVV